MRRITFIFILLLISLLFTQKCIAQEQEKPKILNLHEIINHNSYPDELKAHPISGSVEVEIWLDHEGDILKYNVSEASNKDLAAFLVSRIKLLEFIPARNEYGIRTGSKIKVPFHFKLDQDLAKN